MPQLFEYLRLLCLEHHLPSLSGVLTDYKDWIFVKYSLEDEVREVHKSPGRLPNLLPVSYDLAETICLRDQQLRLHKRIMYEVMDVIKE